MTRADFFLALLASLKTFYVNPFVFNLTKLLHKNIKNLRFDEFKLNMEHEKIHNTVQSRFSDTFGLG